MVILPIRSFRDGKRRLVALDPARRAELLRGWATVVLRAAHDLPVVVVTDDPDVESWAARHGTATARPATPGLDAAADAGRDVARRAGLHRVLVAHADLPLATDLRPAFDVPSDVVAVADRRGDGTNVLVVPTDEHFRFAYGPGSFASHRAEAERLGWTFTAFAAPELALDVDDPADLDALGDLGGSRS